MAKRNAKGGGRFRLRQYLNAKRRQRRDAQYPRETGQPQAKYRRSSLGVWRYFRLKECYRVMEGTVGSDEGAEEPEVGLPGIELPTAGELEVALGRSAIRDGLLPSTRFTGAAFGDATTGLTGDRCYGSGRRRVANCVLTFLPDRAFSERTIPKK